VGQRREGGRRERRNTQAAVFAHGNAACLERVRDIMQVCECFCPVEGQPGYQIQVVPVITCVDELTDFDGQGPEALHQPSDAMHRLEGLCRVAGVDPRTAVFVGWLHKKNINYADMNDGRVQALWRILSRSVRFGTCAKAQMREAQREKQPPMTTPACPSPGLAR
jgi:hypothetical protein